MAYRQWTVDTDLAVEPYVFYDAFVSILNHTTPTEVAYLFSDADLALPSPTLGDPLTTNDLLNATELLLASMPTWDQSTYDRIWEYYCDAGEEDDAEWVDLELCYDVHYRQRFWTLRTPWLWVLYGAFALAVAAYARPSLIPI